MSESMQSSSSGSPSQDTGTSSLGSNVSRSEAQDQNVGDSSGSSPIDMECNIQTERITKSLDKLVYRTKLSLCIPALMRDKILTNILSSRYFQDAAFIIFQYVGDNAFSKSCINMNAVKDVQAGNMSLKHRVNSDLSHLLCTLCSYPALEPHVERLVEKMKRDTLCSGDQSIKSPGLNHLLKLEEFRDLMVQRMKTTAAEEMSAVIRTRKLEKSNIECLNKIAEDKKCIQEEKLQHEEQYRHKVEVIAQLKRDIQELQQKFSIGKKKQILDSERQMVLATRSHKVKYEILKEEVADSKEVYNNSLIINMTAEKQLRDRRRKVETQLLSWVQKYDLEMTAKQQELDEVTKQYEDEVKKCNELELKLQKQNEEFFPLMEERDAEYHQEMTAKLDKFIVEHAARVIQTAWRDTLKNRAEKKRLIKLKNKMQAEKQAAAKKAEIEAKQKELLEKKQRAEEKAAAKAGKSEPKPNKDKEEEEEAKPNKDKEEEAKSNKNKEEEED